MPIDSSGKSQYDNIDWSYLI